MEIAARHIKRKQLGQYLDKDVLHRERKSTVSTSVIPTLADKKRRLTSELQSESSNKKMKIASKITHD